MVYKYITIGIPTKKQLKNNGMNEELDLQKKDIDVDLRNYTERYETNPFVVKLKGRMYLQPKVNAVIAKNEALVNRSTGEVLGDDMLIGRRKIVDKSQFTKMYVHGLNEVLEMSKPAVNTFIYLLKNMDFDNKSFIIAEKDCLKVGYKTAASVTNGLRELIKRDVIAKAVMPCYYWINPLMVCKGERFAMYTEVVTEEKAKNEEFARQLKEQQNALGEQINHQIDKMNKAEEKKYYAEQTDDNYPKLPFPNNFD